MFSIYPLSEQSVTIEFGNQISDANADAIHDFNLLLKQNAFEGLVDTVSGYSTLTIFYDIILVSKSELPGMNAFSKVSTYLASLKDLLIVKNRVSNTVIEIPVFYGGQSGPDLQEVANHAQLSIDEVINIHSISIYKVFMIGFVPGFPYMGGMDERISAPRKSTPKANIPAGSVGIAGAQTGVYPLNTPGGWQIIGITPLVLFDPKRTKPSLLSAGDSVKFVPITINEYLDFQT